MVKTKEKGLRDIIPKSDKLKHRLEPIDDLARIDEDSAVMETEMISPDELFGDTGGESQSNPSKELFNPKNPKIKSEFSNREILIMARLYELSRKYYEPLGTYMLRDVLDQLVILRISKDRASRKEFVETNREAQKNKDTGFLSRLVGGGSQI